MQAARGRAADSVGVAQVEPARAPVGQHSAGLGEDGSHGVDVCGGAVLVAVLAHDAIVALGPVGRAGHDAVGRAVRQGGKHVACVADE